MTDTDDLNIKSAEAAVTVRPATGRVTSMRIRGTQILYQGDRFGSFPMAPWCGRLGDGQLTFDGTTYDFPQSAPPHAMHGTVRDHPWEVVTHTPAQLEISQRLEPRWPFPGVVTQRFTLGEQTLDLEMRVAADTQPFPAQAGWHPWFRRHLVDGAQPVQIRFTPAWQEERDDRHLPTGNRIDPLLPPWDDCFGMPDGVDVVCDWPGQLQLQVRSDARWVVVFDERDYGVCVEPQTGPPNALNTDPRIVSRGDDLVITARWSWEG